MNRKEANAAGAEVLNELDERFNREETRKVLTAALRLSRESDEVFEQLELDLTEEA